MKQTRSPKASEMQASQRSHWSKVRRSLLTALIMVSVSLAIGVEGYHHFGGFSLVDSFLEASMILGGMGPIATLTNDSVKIFAACYALFSGLMLVSTTGFLLAPWLQRLMYHTHRQASCDVIHEHDKAMSAKK